jgi:hypothetical protein
MDGAWLVRLRWRRRGAWLWPAFVALTLADAFVGHALPPAGNSQSFVAAGLLGLVLNVLAVLLLSRPGAAFIRRRRPDLPVVVARDYAGTTTILSVAVALLAVGLIHRPSIQAHDRDLREAVARAQAWIGDRAPAEFRRNAEHLNTFEIQPGIYRTCVPSADGRRAYCVIVKTQLPFQQSVRFDGYEPNSLFSEGVG